MFQDKHTKCCILKHSIVRHWQMHFTVFSEPKGARAHTHTHTLDG